MTGGFGAWLNIDVIAPKTGPLRRVPFTKAGDKYGVAAGHRAATSSRREAESAANPRHPANTLPANARARLDSHLIQVPSPGLP